MRPNAFVWLVLTSIGSLFPFVGCSSDPDDAKQCTQRCDERACGDNGCGGTCGTCEQGTCNEDGQCELPEPPLGAPIGAACTAADDCASGLCSSGADYPGGYCSLAACSATSCPSGAACIPGTPNLCLASCLDDSDCRQADGYGCDGRGVCTLAQVCERDCGGRACGDDGCGGACGACDSGEHCEDGACVADCTPDCASRECGDDGCGGQCDVCDADETCNAFGRCVSARNDIGLPCEADADCEDGTCLDDLPDGYCVALCTGSDCPDGTICYGADDDGEGICLRSCEDDSDCRVDYTCDSDDTCWSYEETCEPVCDARACGNDGCGGSCGTCAGNSTCDTQGQCVANCTPSCEGKSCGDNGCGGSCGTCGSGLSCDARDQCVADCTPSCDGQSCGDNGCGGSCGNCGSGLTCTDDGQCVATCVGSCVGRSCGDNGCGGACGTCGSGLTCNASGQCISNCVGSCVGRSCGDNGCGASCGTCDGDASCNASGQCIPNCVGNCSGRECGDNGCGSSCGTCSAGEVCNAGQQCECVPQCAGKNCGDNGCGGSCGNCGAGQFCGGNQQCQCEPQCAGKNCGDNGCGGNCGTCSNGQVCGDVQVCEAACSPSCGGRQCGDDGCDGICGTCSDGFTCAAGACLTITSEPPTLVGSASPGVVKAGTAVTVTLDVSDINNDFDHGVNDLQSVVVDLSAFGGATNAAMTAGAIVDTKTRRYTTSVNTTSKPTGPYLLQAKVTDSDGHVVYDTVTVIVYTGAIREVGAGAQYASISAGIAAAASNDYVHVASGTYVGSENKNLTIGKNIIVGGDSATNSPIIDCENAGRAFHLRNSNEAPTTVIAYLGMTKCNAAAIRLRVEDASVVKPTLVGLRLYSNTNADHGGALIADGVGVEPTLVDCTISANRLTGSLTGAAAAVLNGAIVTMRDTAVSGNISGSAGYAAGIVVQSGARLHVSDSTFEVQEGGRALSLNPGSTAQTSTLLRTRFINNRAGAILLDTYGRAKLTVVDSGFIGNQAGAGAAILGAGVGNCSTSEGGVVITGSHFRGNKTTAGGEGGAIRLAEYGGSYTKVAISNSDFEGNESGSGGAIYVGSSCYSRFSQLTFKNNSASSSGGALYFSARSYPATAGPTLNGLVFEGNIARDGGGMHLTSGNDSSASLSSLLFVNNRATGKGGGLYLRNSTTVRYITTKDNIAVTSGAGVYIDIGDNILSDSIITDGLFVVPEQQAKPIVQRVNVDPTLVSDTGLRINEGNGYFVGTDGNIFADPRFVAGPRGAYYLAQMAAGQPANSPCVNPIGGVPVDEFSPVLGLTTRTDGGLDAGTGDLGYHYLP